MTFGQQPQATTPMDSTASRMGRTNTIRTRIRTGSTARIRTVRTNTSTRRRTCMRRALRRPPFRLRRPYSYERAEHASVTRAYGEMTIGLLVTAAVAILTQATGAYIALIQSLGVIGAWAPFVVEIVIAIYLAPH